MRQPVVTVLLAVPIIVRNLLPISADRRVKLLPSLLLPPQIALFGFQSGAALATVVGVLVEVPVMLSVVRIVLRSRAWYQAG